MAGMIVQPQFVTRLIQSRLTSDIRFAWSSPFGNAALFRQSVRAGLNASAVRAIPTVKVLGSPVTGQRWLDLGDHGINYGQCQAVTQSVGITIGAIAVGVSVGQEQWFSQRTASGVNFEQIVFAAGLNATLGTTNANLTLVARNSAGTNCHVIATSGCDGLPHVFIGGLGQNESYLYRDGVPLAVASTTLLTGTVTHGNQKVRVGNSADTISGGLGVDTGSLHFVVVWDRLLSPAEAMLWSANPWQIFEQRKRFSIRGAAAAVAAESNHRVPGGGWGGRVIAYPEVVM